MIVTANALLFPQTLTFGKLSPNGRQVIKLSSAENAVVVASFKAFLQAHFSKVRLISGPKLITYFDPIFKVNRTVRSGFMYETGTNPPRPDDVKSVIDRVVKVDNDFFQRRKRAGEIVVAPYVRGRIQMIESPGEVKTPVPAPTHPGYYITQFTELYSVVSVPLSGSQMYWDSIGYFLTSWGAINAQDSAYNITYVMPRDLGFDGNIESFYDLMTSSEQNKNLVTGAVADANKGVFDVLTNLAELPESSRMVFNALSTLRTLLSSFKRRKFELTRGHERTFNKIGKSINKAREELRQDFLKRQQRAVERSWPSSAKNRLVANYARKLDNLSKLEKTQKKIAAKELASSIANAWLGVRYGVMPIVYAFEDYQEFRAAMFASYKTTRKRDSISIQLPKYSGWSALSSVATQRHSVFIKRKLNDANLIAKRGQLMGDNILSTAWELVPYSFVVDWFLNVGDFIAASSSVEVYQSEGATYSVRGNLDTVYQHESGAKVSIFGSRYYRTPLNTCNAVGLTLQFNMDLKRSVDAVALLWQRVKRQ